MAVNNHDFKDQVRATFLLSQHVIERLKHWISKQIIEKNDPKSPYISAFVAICAFVWVCLIKSQSSISHHSDRPSFDNDEPWHFCFVADCRNRYEFSLVPETYFGNCLAICFVSAERRGDLVGKNGVSIAAKAIGSRIMELSTGALIGAEEWLLKWEELSSGHLVTVTGSPKLSVYGTDFGWGKPKKSEVVQIDVSGAISLAESRDEEGGVEVGLALSRAEMDAFSTLFKEGLENLF